MKKGSHTIAILQMGLVPILVAGIVGYAALKRVDVFSAFLKGAKEGLRTALNILPVMVGMLIAVAMLRASGALGLLTDVLSPVLRLLGIPEQCAALVLLKPVSGGGGLALGSEIMKRFGADSYPGRVAAVMLGASETSVYTIGVYAGHIGLTQLRYTVLAAILADLTAFVSSSALVRIFYS